MAWDAHPALWWATSRIRYDNWNGPTAFFTPTGFMVNPGAAVGSGSQNAVQKLELSAYYFLDPTRMQGAVRFFYGYPWEGPEIRIAGTVVARTFQWNPWMSDSAQCSLQWETTYSNMTSGGSGPTGAVYSYFTAFASSSDSTDRRTWVGLPWQTYGSSVDQPLDPTKTLNIAITLTIRVYLQGVAFVFFDTPLEVSIPPFTVLIVGP